jgi:hypothetical protein
MPVFDDRLRSDATPARYEESSFEFLNRVAGPFWEHPRALIEEWCSHLPDDAEYKDIRNRLRSRNDGQYNSAFLELYVHEVLRRTHHDVIIHPTLSHTTRRPDFYAERGGLGFYVEAIVPGVSKKVDAARARRNRLIDVVNRLDEPNFLLWLHSLKEGVADPEPARLRSALRGWLRLLDPDTVDSYNTAPRFRWNHKDWAAEFVAIPVKKAARTQSRADRRAIAVDGHAPVEWVDDAVTIRKALEAKHRDYGALDSPFLIVVGLFIHDTDHWHSMNAFYGHERAAFTDGGDEASAFRVGDGYFGKPGRWRNTNVSGVLLVNQLQPFHLHKTQATLWVHPGADHPLPELGWPGESVLLSDHLPVARPAPVAALQLFGLPDPWPPGDPWTR